jgi:5-methylcytosine-specific restriction enzyme subunit McrC
VLDEKTGVYEFVDFVRDEKKMAVIFENFIRNFYREQLRHFGYEVKPEIIHWDVAEADPLAMDYLPIMKTDISITSPSRKVIIDTKYYKECFQVHFEKKTLISGHFYQLIEYLENSDAQSGSTYKSEGILLYPAVDFHDSIPFPILRGHKVTVRMINLNQDWRKISTDLLSFVNSPITK